MTAHKSLLVTHTLQWYKDRIGRSVYRKPGSTDQCMCSRCLKIFNTPIEITDAKVAQRLFEMEYEMSYEFFDTVQV